MRVAFLVFVATIINGCNSSNTNPDYRDSFVGEYLGIHTNSSWNLNEPGSTSEIEDTVLVITIGDSSVQIGSTEIDVSPDGTFHEQGTSSTSSYYAGRFFSGDSLQIDVNGGGLGGGYRSTFQGKRF